MASIQELEEKVNKLIGVVKNQEDRITSLEAQLGNTHIIVGTASPEDVLTEDKDNGTLYFQCDTEIEEVS